MVASRSSVEGPRSSREHSNVVADVCSGLERSQSLEDRFRHVVQSCAKVTEASQRLNYLTDDARPLGNLSFAGLYSLNDTLQVLIQQSSELSRAINARCEEIERSVLVRLESLVQVTGRNDRSQTQQLFEHYEDAIRGILRKFRHESQEDMLLWRFAEECYKEASNPGGILNADDFRVSTNEPRPQWYHSSDFTSEHSDEQEGHHDIDQENATRSQSGAEHGSQGRSSVGQRWINFWATALNNLPSGPTLFQGVPGSNTAFQLSKAVPPILFRTYIRGAHSIDIENGMSPTGCASETGFNTQVDLLSPHRKDAAEVLWNHLDRSWTSILPANNLMSWTSSCVYAIQYAVYRVQQRKGKPSDTMICVVRTEGFPKGQFAQDFSLIEMFQDSGQAKPCGAQSFFDFRIRDSRYHNGEHLLQGRIDLHGRSCIISLEMLVKAGLYRLYPEFTDRDQGWAQRTFQLRGLWEHEQETADWEIELALRIGHECCGNFAPLELALMLLMMKNRKYKDYSFR